MRAFLEAFGRELARVIWKDLLGIAAMAALLTLLERHSKRQFAAEISRLARAAGDSK